MTSDGNHNLGITRTVDKALSSDRAPNLEAGIQGRCVPCQLKMKMYIKP